MIRLLLRLFGIKDFDTCKSCETLKQQLEYERNEKKQLTETLLNIITPKVVQPPVQELQPITQTAGLFSRRRAILEERDRAEAALLKSSTLVGRPDAVLENKNIKTTEELEKELAIPTKKEA